MNEEGLRDHGAISVCVCVCVWVYVTPNSTFEPDDVSHKIGSNITPS